MKLLFYFGHPAQYFFLRATIKNLLQNEQNECVILIKTKDVLENLIKADGLNYRNILPLERGKSKLSIFLSLIKRLTKILPLLLKNRPDLMVGTDATIAILGRILWISRITITEDDYDVIKHLAQLTYPYAETILCPVVCDVGNYNRKKIGYEGYMKLGYLHPNVFQPDINVLSKYRIPEDFILIRLARLSAHHDFGISGISREVLDDVINLAVEKGFTIMISSECQIPDKYKPYLLKIAPSDMHHLLAQALILISDSQSMSMEAAMLGVPSIRFSSFAGRISVLEELEHKYELTYGIDPSNKEELLRKVKALLSTDNIRNTYKLKRDKMISDKIDVTAFLLWFIENYPESVRIMRENPDYQMRFK